MKGKAQIILTDVRDGKSRIIHEENMFTNALDSLYNGNPYGLNSRAVYKDGTVSGISSGNLYAKTALGGILCFPNEIPEDADHLYEPLSHQPTAYASNDAYTGSNAKRGSFNAFESGPITNGYKFVWDFATNQGNGQIGALALTHARAGISYFDDITTALDGGVFNPTAYTTLGPGHGIRINGYANGAREVLAYNDEELLAVFYDGTVRKAYLKPHKISVFSFLDFSDNDSVNSLFKVVDGKSYSDTVPYIKAGDTFYKVTGKTSTSLTWEHYDINYNLIDSGTWTMSGVSLLTSGVYFTCISNGYLYWPSTANTTYQINISNLADVTQTALVSGSTYTDLGDGLVMNSYGFAGNGVGISKNTADVAILPFAKNGVWMTELQSIGAYSYVGMSMTNFLLTPYLATINNLESPVVKTADKTMKIIYQVTEA